MSATILEVLGAKDDFPPELVAQAKNLYEATLVYGGHAEKAIAGIVRDMTVLKITKTEALVAIEKVLDIKDAVDTRAADAFVEISRDFSPKKVEEPKPPTTPYPAPASATSSPAPTSPPSNPAGPITTNNPTPATTSQASIADLIKEKLEGGAGSPGAGSSGQGPDSQPKSDPAQPETKPENATGLAAPATKIEGNDPSKNVV